MAKKAQIIRTKKAKKYRVKKAGRLFAFLFVLLIGAFILFLNSGYFDISEIAVTGNVRFSKEDILSLSGLNPGESILRMDKQRIEESIAANPYLQATVIRQFPSTVEIRVAERTPGVILEYNGAFFLADRQFVLLERLPENTAEFVLVRGLVLRGETLGKRADGLEGAQIDKAEELLNLMEVGGFLQSVELLDFTVNNDIFFKTREGFNVKLGLPVDLTRKISYYLPALAEAKQQGNSSGTLDLSVPDHIVFIPAAQNAPNNGDS